MPRLSVVLSTHNDGPYLRAALDSVLAQTFTDFELIVIDDGSTDGTADLLATYADARLRVITHESAQTLPVALNAGIAVASGELIARMDGDDVAYAQRFAQQIAYLDAHPEVDILGTQTDFIYGERPVQAHKAYPTAHSLIAWYLLVDDAIVHPTVMLRRRLLDLRTPFYDPAFATGQDRDLWLVLMDRVRFANLPEPLLARRLHRRSVTRRKSGTERDRLADRQRRAAEALLGHALPAPDTLRLMYPPAMVGRLYSDDHARTVIATMIELYTALCQARIILAEERALVSEDIARRALLLAQRTPAGMRHPLHGLATWLDTFMPRRMRAYWRRYVRRNP